ncbi:MAG: NAD(P)-dependent oxidoreductase [Alphaproteobacteria bacterium]|nr:NAD(P)-dependent oxidoreductase [Alphaproteobacteria bacterium]
MDEPRIGWIGVGLMGHGAAKNILARGYPLAILGHRNRQPVDDLVRRGATEAASPAALAAAADIVFLCLPSSAVVEAVVLGAGGLLGALRPGQIVVDTSTADPDSTMRVGVRLAERGIAMVDAPFNRTPKEAEEAKLNSMVGGDPAAVERVRPVIACYSERVFTLGRLGDGHRVKLLNNLLSLSNTVLVAEAIAAAARLGIDLRTFYDIAASGGGNSRTLHVMMPWALAGDGSLFQAALWLGDKDLGAYLKMAAGIGAPTVMARAAQSVYQQMRKDGHGERHMPCLSELIAARYGGHIRDLP